jgi:hypothetical protein
MPDGGTVRPDIDMPTPDPADLSTDMDVWGTSMVLDAYERVREATSEDIEDERIDISLGDSEERVLSDTAEIHAALAALPERQDVTINSEAELTALVRSIDTVEDLPREVRSEIDIDTDSADAHAALSAVLSQAELLEHVDPTVEVDTETDTSALGALRSIGDREGIDLDFDTPDLGTAVRDTSRLAGFADEAASGFSRLAAGASRGVPGLGGAAAAVSSMSGPALAGAGLGAGALASMAVGGASALGGAAVGGGGLAGALALGVKLNTSDREIKATKQRIQDELGVLEGNVDFEFVSDVIQTDLPMIVGQVADEVNAISGELRGTFSEIRGRFWREFPSLLDAASDSVTTLDSHIADMTVGGDRCPPWYAPVDDDRR